MEVYKKSVYAHGRVRKMVTVFRCENCGHTETQTRERYNGKPY